MTVTLLLEPASRSCWEEPVHFAVRGLAPEQPVTLRASLRDENGTLFRAHARYRADARRELNLERAPALGGSFAGCEPMGLLWALEPEKALGRLVKRDVRTPFPVRLEVLDGHDPEPGRLLCQARHERDFLPPGVRREPVRAGRVRATLFLPPEPGPFPGIVDIFGTGGGLLEYRASLLAGKGFAVMALASYRPHKTIKMLNLEYFEEAVNYLLSHAEVKGPGARLLGISKGDELCLSMASFLKGIMAAVIINGSVASAEGGVHCNGETLPPVGVNKNRIKVTKDGFADIVDDLNSPLEGPDQKSFIPVESAESFFLFLVDEDDCNWKSEFYANETCKHLQAQGRRKPQVICYPGAGHCIEPPYFPVPGFHACLGGRSRYLGRGAQGSHHGSGGCLEITPDFLPQTLGWERGDNPSQTHFGRPRWADHLRSGVGDQPGQHDETPSLLIIQKISQAWCHAPVVPAIREAEAGELLDPGRRKLQ
ncbi:LOW QUALITY PROTEIN: Acyl-coenzyme A thioesterase 2, mitochondrial [Plecturocebus cupreus]